MSIYLVRDYGSEYRRNAEAGLIPMLDGQISRTVPDFDAVNILRILPPPELVR